LTSISAAENNVSVSIPASSLMHHGRERAADRFGERDAVVMGDERWSFGDLDGPANACARHLVAHGVGTGDRVAVLATYTHLRRVVEVDAVPRLPSGKVLRRTLRDEWAPLIGAGKEE
jgi:acyl-CoA synthetase (AMP-forming)/AMP-acid ligase II